MKSKIALFRELAKLAGPEVVARSFRDAALRLRGRRGGISQGGGLRLTTPRPTLCGVEPSPSWKAPRRLDNSGYITPMESQGQNPWCAAYGGCALLQASYWRTFGEELPFDEAACYAECKKVDGSAGDGTTLEAVLFVLGNTDLTGKKIIPTITEKTIEATDIPFCIHHYGVAILGLEITEGWRYTKLGGNVGDGTNTIGGHCVLCSAYDLDAGELWGPNWWGRQWGRDGMWRMTFDQFNAQFFSGFAVDVQWPTPSASTIHP